jgi:Uncharacterized protein conserved in bacteria (DUF2188).
MSRKSHHVVHNPQGGWDVKKGGADRASAHCETKIEAIKIGREISQNQKSEFLIHNLNGKIGSADSHGHDPFPPRG